jgi:hypothetical protein
MVTACPTGDTPPPQAASWLEPPPATAAAAATADGDDATTTAAAGAAAPGDGTVAVLIGRCPERGLLLPLLPCKLLHLPPAAAAMRSAPPLTRPRLPEGDCMPAPPPLPPSMCGPWPRLRPRMLPHDCRLNSPLLALLEERL